MNKIKRYNILYRLRAKSPRPPTTELIYHSNFELLIAVLLSSQTTDVSVNKVTKQLFAVAATPKAMLKLGIDGIKNYIQYIGLYNKKTNNIIKTCELLLDQHQGEVPQERSALEALPGVGKKTAGIVLNTAFGRPTIAVDRHVFRVANRTNLAVGKNAKAVEKKLLEVVPKDFRIDCHHSLVLHGRYVCIARKPHCSSCLIKDLCEYDQKCLPTIK